MVFGCVWTHETRFTHCKSSNQLWHAVRVRMDAFPNSKNNHPRGARMIDALLERGARAFCWVSLGSKHFHTRPVGTSRAVVIYIKREIEKQTPKVSRAFINLGAWEPGLMKPIQRGKKTRAAQSRPMNAPRERDEHSRVWWTTAPSQMKR